jgi:lipopolysaccharide transport system permease protein
VYQGTVRSPRPSEEVTLRVRAEDEWTENRPSDGRRVFPFDELWHARELAYFLALRDVKARYKQAVFGAAWAVVQPLLGALLLTVVFGRLAEVSSDGIPYVVFAFAGFSLWSYFSAAFTNARGSLLSNAPLVTKVYFPRMIAPIAAVLPGLLDLAVASVVLAALMAWEGVTPGWPLVLAPVVVLGTVALALGVGLLAAALVVQFRDVQPIVVFVLQLWLFASPVAYPSGLVEGAWRWLYYANPMAGLLDAWRWSVIGGPSPTREAFVSVAAAVIALAGGAYVFQRLERRFADVI